MDDKKLVAFNACSALNALIHINCFRSILKVYAKYFLYTICKNENDNQLITMLNHLKIDDGQLVWFICKIRDHLLKNIVLEVNVENNECCIVADTERIIIGEVENHEQVEVGPYEDNFPVDLFIFVIFNGEPKGCHIFDFEKFEMYPGKEKGKENLFLYKFEDQEEAIDNGESKYGRLIPNELRNRLKNEFDKFGKRFGKRVWIYCDSEDVNSIWEWLYFSPKTSDNAKNEQKRPRHRCIFKRKQRIPDNGFFWGDRFFLVRVSKNYLFQEELTFKTDELAFLRDSSWPYVGNEENYLDLCMKKCEPIDYNYDKPPEFNNQNYKWAHIALCAEKLNEECSLDEISLPEGNNKLYFLFLNICKCDQNLRSAFVDKFPTKAWIDTSSEVSKKNVENCNFSNYFYQEFCKNGKNVVEAATEARNRIDTEGSKNLWRLAYVVNGNPYIKAERCQEVGC